MHQLNNGFCGDAVLEDFMRKMEKAKGSGFADIMKGILITALHIAVLAGALFIYMFSVTGVHL
jgi:hypothetical protein